MTPKEYVRKFKKFIKQRLQGTKLLPSIIMAHAMYEAASDDGAIGKSIHAEQHNNDVRMLADKSWRGRKVLLPVRQFPKNKKLTRKTWFRAYSSSERDIEDRIEMLTLQIRAWPTAFFYHDTIKCQATMLQLAGVSADPQYAERMVKIINKHRLYRIDRQWWIERGLRLVLSIPIYWYVFAYWDEWVPWR